MAVRRELHRIVWTIVVSVIVRTGTGSEVMQSIATPMVGGMITAPLLSMFVIPAVYLLVRRPRERMVFRIAFWRKQHVAG